MGRPRRQGNTIEEGDAGYGRPSHRSEGQYGAERITPPRSLRDRPSPRRVSMGRPRRQGNTIEEGDAGYGRPSHRSEGQYGAERITPPRSLRDRPSPRRVSMGRPRRQGNTIEEGDAGYGRPSHRSEGQYGAERITPPRSLRDRPSPRRVSMGRPRRKGNTIEEVTLVTGDHLIGLRDNMVLNGLPLPGRYATDPPQGGCRWGGLDDKATHDRRAGDGRPSHRPEGQYGAERIAPPRSLRDRPSPRRVSMGTSTSGQHDATGQNHDTAPQINHDTAPQINYDTAWQITIRQDDAVAESLEMAGIISPRHCHL